MYQSFVTLSTHGGGHGYGEKMFPVFTFLWSPHAVPRELEFLFLCKNSRDKDSKAVRYQITEVLPTVCTCSAGFLLCVCGARGVGVTNDWCLII